MKKISIRWTMILLFIAAMSSVGAQTIHGVVYEQYEGEKRALPGVNIYWSESTQGTATAADGSFVIKSANDSVNALVFSFVGYLNDTLILDRENRVLEVILTKNNELDEVEIFSRRPGTTLSRTAPIPIEHISGAELHKAACCNLGESFETNASVDVHYSDAVTGAKQIQLLGLAGVYSQMMTENIPNMYGLATAYGLGYIPGSWMESIQVSKGAASVLDGYSSVTGQINTNTKNPATSEKLFFNALMNSMGKYESNFTSAMQLNDQWSTALLLHAENSPVIQDVNRDGFLDMPLLRQYNVMNKWKYFGRNGFMAQAGVKYIDEVRCGGEVDFNTEILSPGIAYGIGITTRRAEGFMKLGYEMPGNTDLNMALKTTASWHAQSSFFGNNTYDAVEKSVYLNYIFQHLLAGSPFHHYAAGVSFLYDAYHEVFNDSIFVSTEIVPGAFFQYTFQKENLPTVIVGLRADHHNLHGLFFTPRLHIRYALNAHNILRGSAGKGYRTAHVLSENSFLFASSRRIRIKEAPEMEEAWNYGITYTHYRAIASRELSVNIALYRSDFKHQVIVDMDRDLSSIWIANLSGKSYSNVFQVEAKYALFQGMELLLAYRWQDVRYTANDELIVKPLVTRYKGLFNASYATRLKKWQVDFTAILNGDQRLPSTVQNPEQYQRPDKAPAYVIMNAQITKYFRRWNLYVGAENLTGFTQKNPIIAADDPFSEYFDASMVWGPLVGRKYYIGIRINPFN
ncbi:MAG: TonB-dependent receptor [Bacteroidia bacterium]|nr:TonB-dependent receptor [Bacteroidia bacterium]